MSGDVRESPAIDVIRMLARRGGEILYHDPHVPELEVEEVAPSNRQPVRYLRTELTTELVQSVDCVVIMTDHVDIDYCSLVNHAAVVVDTRNATKSITKNQNKVLKI